MPQLSPLPTLALNGLTISTFVYSYVQGLPYLVKRKTLSFFFSIWHDPVIVKTFYETRTKTRFL